MIRLSMRIGNPLKDKPDPTRSLHSLSGTDEGCLMPDHAKKARNKRIKQEARKRRARADKLNAQHRKARKRAKYGVSGKPAPVTRIRLDTGEIVDRTSQAGLSKQVGQERARREHEERMAAYTTAEETARSTCTRRDREKGEWFERCLAENKRHFQEYEEWRTQQGERNEEIWAAQRQEHSARVRALMDEHREIMGLPPKSA